MMTDLTQTISTVAVGDDLPKLDIPITTKLVVSGAMASQDFQDIHHDKSAAQAAGTPDVFMNVLTSNGMVGRYLTGWAGPGARVRRIKFKIGSPNFPGDTMTMQGEVIGLETDGDARIAHVDFKGKNAMGYHVTGEAWIDLGEAG